MDKLDPVAVAVFLVGSLLGPEIAHVVGPYAVIFLGSTTGAAWALGRHEPMNRWHEFIWYFSKVNFTSLLVAVPLALLAINVFKLEEANWLLVPISMLVGGIGDDWPKVGRWVIERLGRLIERRAGVGDPGKGD
jgi:hypothetical protein